MLSTIGDVFIKNLFKITFIIVVFSSLDFGFSPNFSTVNGII
jgi:hypothetical protein